jgi:hypothetical protein
LRSSCLLSFPPKTADVGPFTEELRSHIDIWGGETSL